MRFEIYREGNGLQGLAAIVAGQGTRGQWRWRLRGDNGETIASGEDYVNRADCDHAIGLVKGTNDRTPVIDLTR